LIANIYIKLYVACLAKYNAARGPSVKLVTFQTKKSAHIDVK
jgi:hypothetical protein